MPRLKLGDTAPRREFSFPWRVALLLAVIAGIGWFGWAKYRHLHPLPVAEEASQLAEATEMPIDADSPLIPFIKKLNLTQEQQIRVAEISLETTSAKVMLTQFMKLLTPEQRKEAAPIRKELAAAQRLQAAKQKEKMKKYYPGNDLKVAKAGNALVRAQREQRKKAAKQAAATVTPKP
jgi:hypothetical protein